MLFFSSYTNYWFLLFVYRMVKIIFYYVYIWNKTIFTYRTQFIDDTYQEVLDLLLPLNLEVIVERNLSWEWYQEVPCFNVNAQLKPMEVIFFGCLLISVLLVTNSAWKHKIFWVYILHTDQLCQSWNIVAIVT